MEFSQDLTSQPPEENCVFKVKCTYFIINFLVIIINFLVVISIFCIENVV